jgi:SAM-dependent methyltransferase
MSQDLINYYRDRAKEYENIYFKPERQEDIKASCEFLQQLFKDKDVFEIACGTGFWTQFIAQSAKSVLATDINLAVIEIALKKEIIHPDVKFEVADFYKFDPGKKFQSLFGGFIWSHILKQDLGHFFKTINNFVEKDGTVVLMDNAYVEGSNHPVTETDASGNTYQTRKLQDGSSHKVLKNFATEDFLRDKLKHLATEIRFIQRTYFWILIYKPV